MGSEIVTFDQKTNAAQCDKRRRDEAADLIARYGEIKARAEADAQAVEVCRAETVELEGRYHDASKQLADLETIARESRELLDKSIWHRTGRNLEL